MRYIADRNFLAQRQRQHTIFQFRGAAGHIDFQRESPGGFYAAGGIGLAGYANHVAFDADVTRSVKAAWRFPLEIDVTSSTAKLENGVLTLMLGKKIPVSKVSQLAIQ